MEDEAAEEGSTVKQTVQYAEQQHDPRHDHDRGIIPHEQQQLRQGYDQQHHHGYPEHHTVSSQPGYDVQQGQQSLQEAAFSSVTSSLDNQRGRVQEDSRRQFTHPSGQQTLQEHEQTHPGETNLDDEIGQEHELPTPTT